jgi:hypothetical protein
MQAPRVCSLQVMSAQPSFAPSIGGDKVDGATYRVMKLPDYSPIRVAPVEDMRHEHGAAAVLE